MSTEANLGVVRRFYQAFQNRDIVLMRELLAEDVTWTDSEVSGVCHGVDELIARVGRIIQRCDDSYEVRLVHLAADAAGRVLAVQAFTAERGDRSLRITEPVLYTLADGRILAVDNFYAEPGAKEKFWHS